MFWKLLDIWLIHMIMSNILQFNHIININAIKEIIYWKKKQWIIVCVQMFYAHHSCIITFVILINVENSCTA